MDKNSFESYEYLPGETNSDEFFVVQDDGTFLLNRQVQYVTQVEDVKEALDETQTCAVYDVTPQQYLVDVTDNSSELISVPENYILPAPSQDETNNLYSNSFLFQVVSNENVEQTDKNLTNSFKEETHQEEGDIINIVNKKGNSCTEITLSDDQYKALEQKGWVLLESDDKAFILDAYGLHDVTAKIDSMQSMRNSCSLDLDTRPLKTENVTSVLKLESICELNQPPQMDTSDVVNDNENCTENVTELSSAAKEDKNNMKLQKLAIEYITEATTNDILEQIAKPPIDIKEIIVEVPKCEKVNTVHFKTKYCFKDVPDKIVLGKTQKGKKLVAKVVKRVNGKAKMHHSNQFKQKDSNIQVIKPIETPVNVVKKPIETPVNVVKETSNKHNDTRQFELLVQDALGRDSECSAEQVAAASEIVSQLSQVPAFQTCVTGRNVIITKVVEKEPKKITTTSFVTGIVTTIEDGTCRFSHVPDLLDKIMAEYMESRFPRPRASKSVLKPRDVKVPDLAILHVNITETKCENNVETISVVLNERILPCELLSIKRPASKIHACGSCASIFYSEVDLMEHQEAHVIDAEDTLTIDTDKLLESSLTDEKPYHLVKAEKGTEYACYQCTMKFKTIHNCLKHMKIHASPQTIETKGTRQSEDKVVKNTAKAPLHKCKMCNSSYFYPSSLSKHICRVHIKDKVIFIKADLNGTS